MIKFLAYLKKMNKLGVAMTEYAVLLAFVAAVGAGFTSDSGLGSSISGAVGKAVAAIGLVSGDIQTSVKGKMDKLLAGFLDGAPLKNEQNKQFKRWESLAKEIVSGGGNYLDDFLKAAGIDTAYSFRNLNTEADMAALKAQGLYVDGASLYKMVTIANDNGVSSNRGSADNPETHFSATQYVFYSKDGNVYLAGTRNLDTVYVHEASNNHGTYTPKEGPAYTITNSFTKGKYQNQEGQWVECNNIQSGFVPVNN